jgi:hypothetical protein
MRGVEHAREMLRLAQDDVAAMEVMEISPDPAYRPKLEA